MRPLTARAGLIDDCRAKLEDHEVDALLIQERGQVDHCSAEDRPLQPHAGGVVVAHEALLS